MNVANTSIPLYQIILLHMKAMNSYCVSCKKKKIMRTKILVLERQSKID